MQGNRWMPITGLREVMIGEMTMFQWMPRHTKIILNKVFGFQKILSEMIPSDFSQRYFFSKNYILHFIII